MFLKTIMDRYKKHRNSIEYWRKRGLVIGNGCEVYSSANFGSEP